MNVDALPTIKGLSHAILAFYAMGPPKRASTRELTQLVLECARCCQTSLVVIDDIHLLELRREADRDANNHLKRLANDLQATFVYAGVGLSHGGFMHQLLTEAAAEAIDTGAERITTRLLDGIDIGYAAEVGAGRQQPRAAAA